MSSKQFQAAYESIHNTGTQLLQYLRELQAGRLKEGDNTKGLQSIEDDISKALNALKEQKYQVAVVAAMKAGKSTFLNALIGADVLASEREACTVCLTVVRPIAAEKTPRLLEYRQGQTKPESIAEGDVSVIRENFLQRTHKIRITNNIDKTTRFELQHPIQAISQLSSLSGFTLVDTPGPNEWESENFDSVALKRTALEALRTCDAILFVLDYTSFKDNTNSELLQELEQRRESLAQNTGKIYFILNKVDQKGANDRAIADVIADLKRDLINFGIPEPIIYSASARQGLLAKLIYQGTATDSQEEDFSKFFAARYAQKDERGRRYLPASDEIAPQALEDSGIPIIEQSVIQTVVQNSGWNLLNDVLAALDKSAKGIEDTLNTQLSGWSLEIETLKKKVEEFRRSSESTQRKVEAVKKSVEEQKQILIRGFSQGISIFAEGAKAKIQDEIDQIAESQSTKPAKTKIQEAPLVLKQTADDIDWGGILGDIGESLLELIPLVGKGLGKIFKVGVRAGESLLNVLVNDVPDFQQSNDTGIHAAYKIRAKTKKDAQKIENTINKFCAPHIQSWWLDTQDILVRDGTKIREELARRIQNDIQHISNELSDKLGEDLQVELNYSPIQFPSFDFQGIDAKIQHQEQLIQRTERIQRVESRFCERDKIYYVDVPVQEKHSFFEVDLQQTADAIKQKIDEQEVISKQILQRVIEKQVSEDFRNAEKQINDYISRFQTEFEHLLKEREMRGEEADQIRAAIETQKAQLDDYLSKLTFIRESLNSWKPATARR